MGQYTSIILIVVMIIAFYFLIMRPQRKRQQQQLEMMKTLEPGTRIVTTTGIYATIVAVGEKQIVLETSPGSQVTMLKQAVGRVVGDEEEDAELGAYRGTGAAAAAPGLTQAPGDSDADTDGEPAGPQTTSASGMAGGAPITEYTPGSGPDFTEPEHQTAPWPPAAGNDPVAGNEPVADNDPAGTGADSSEDAGRSDLADPNEDLTKPWTAADATGAETGQRTGDETADDGAAAQDTADGKNTGDKNSDR